MVARKRLNVMFILIAACLVSCFHGTTASIGSQPSHYRSFVIARKHTTIGRTSLDELSTRRRDLYLTTHNIHNRYPSMAPAGFEPAIPANQRPQTRALDRATTGIDLLSITERRKYKTTANTEDISFLSPYPS